MSWFGKLLGGGFVKSLENVALEAIQTDGEKAEAKALFVKTLDPNGLMRRQISLTVSRLYGLYVIVMLVLIVAQFFGLGAGDNLDIAVTSIKGLFSDITQAFIVIVGASFGVNGVNSFKKQ